MALFCFDFLNCSRKVHILAREGGAEGLQGGGGRLRCLAGRGPLGAPHQPPALRRRDCGSPAARGKVSASPEAASRDSELPAPRRGLLPPAPASELPVVNHGLEAGDAVSDESSGQ